MSRPQSTTDLTPSEYQFVNLLNRLEYGRIERLGISKGQLVLDPPPAIIRSIKFGSTPNQVERPLARFALRKQVAEFFELVRGIDAGEIRVLEVQGGLPYSGQIEDTRYFNSGEDRG